MPAGFPFESVYLIKLALPWSSAGGDNPRFVCSFPRRQFLTTLSTRVSKFRSFSSLQCWDLRSAPNSAPSASSRRDTSPQRRSPSPLSRRDMTSRARPKQARHSSRWPTTMKSISKEPATGRSPAPPATSCSRESCTTNLNRPVMRNSTCSISHLSSLKLLGWAVRSRYLLRCKGHVSQFHQVATIYRFQTIDISSTTLGIILRI